MILFRRSRGPRRTNARMQRIFDHDVLAISRGAVNILTTRSPLNIRSIHNQRGAAMTTLFFAEGVFDRRSGDSTAAPSLPAHYSIFPSWSTSNAPCRPGTDGQPNQKADGQNRRLPALNCFTFQTTPDGFPQLRRWLSRCVAGSRAFYVGISRLKHLHFFMEKNDLKALSLYRLRIFLT